MTIKFNLFVLTTVWILLSIHRMKIDCKESCYYVNFIYTNWTDDRPRFVVNMTFSNSNGIESITTINEEIKSPVTRILVLQQRNKQKQTIVYNATTRLCDMHSLMNAVPLFKPVKDGMLKQSNYSFSCPLNKGVYTMNNMRISPRNPLLSILHQSKGIFLVRGGLLEELPNSELHPLSTYNFAGRIMKKNCGRND